MSEQIGALYLGLGHVSLKSTHRHPLKSTHQGTPVLHFVPLNAGYALKSTHRQTSSPGLSRPSRCSGHGVAKCIEITGTRPAMTLSR
jgi:hypothetical protein